ncbi:MAG: M23 family metallopeptidase [bacterium]|nr:M23 family metallopeptidase [bacterium]
MRSFTCSIVLATWFAGCGPFENEFDTISFSPPTSASQGDAGVVAFAWPVEYRGITSWFRAHRKDHLHAGVDLEARQGDPIIAAAPGYVHSARDRGYGYSAITLVHGAGIATVYGHVSRIDVQRGAQVERGQVIGAVGGTPRTQGAGPDSTGPHLHFEIHIGGFPVDPQAFLPGIGDSY